MDNQDGRVSGISSVVLTEDRDDRDEDNGRKFSRAPILPFLPPIHPRSLLSNVKRASVLFVLETKIRSLRKG